MSYKFRTENEIKININLSYEDAGSATYTELDDKACVSLSLDLEPKCVRSCTT